jgi:hypothetical protein
MTEHNLFYYPNTSFTDAQLALLNVAVPCFDHLHLLDPEKASVRTIGVGEAA